MTAGVIAGVPLIILLFMISRENYLLYHGLIEMLGIVVACGVFMIAFNSREFMQNNFFVFLGISFLYIAIADFLHMLAYKGMSVFPGTDANLATELWIAAGYLRAAAFLIAPVFLKSRLKMRFVFMTYSAAAVLLFLSIFYWKVFPDCFIEGSGLTPFKILSEYLIAAALSVSVIILYNKRSSFDRNIIVLLIASILFTIISGMSFTLYTDVYGLSNFTGHILKLAAYGLIYVAVIQTGLRKPYDLLFRDLKQNEIKLQNALSEVKTLSGILPICANCKNIRNDKGYWQRVEVYVSEHSDARFSHGLCEDCAKKLYPEIFKG